MKKTYKVLPARRFLEKESRKKEERCYIFNNFCLGDVDPKFEVLESAIADEAMVFEKIS